MLPMLLGFLGSGLAGAGALGGMSALAAGAIGSGLGSLIETGDLGEGIKTGIASFMGGKLIGSAASGLGGKGGAEAIAGSAPSLDASGAFPLSGAEVSPLASGASLGSSVPGMAMAGAPALDASGALAGASSTPFLSSAPLGAASTVATSPALNLGATGGIADIASKGMNFMSSPTGIGSAIGASLAAPMPKAPSLGSSTPPPTLGPVTPRPVKTPGTGYNPGTDPEFNYYGTSPTTPTMMGGGSLARFARPSMMGQSARLAPGGLVGLAEMNMQQMDSEAMPESRPELMEPAPISQSNDKDVIVDAVRAIQGKSANPEEALGRFLNMYGEDALRDLVDSVESGEFDEMVDQREGIIKGPGDAMEDMIPASTDDGTDIRLAGDEYIVAGDVVSGLGNGSSDAGAEKLDEMMDRVRMARTGTKQQAPQIDAERMLPA